MPKSAYNVFVSEVRPKVKAANPQLPFGDISKKVGAIWKELSNEDKKPYYDKAGISMDEDVKKQAPKVRRNGKARRSRRNGYSEDDEDESNNSE